MISDATAIDRISNLIINHGKPAVDWEGDDTWELTNEAVDAIHAMKSSGKELHKFIYDNLKIFSLFGITIIGPDSTSYVSYNGLPVEIWGDDYL